MSLHLRNPILENVYVRRTPLLKLVSKYGGDESLQLPKESGRPKMFENHCSKYPGSTVSQSWVLILYSSVVVRSIVYYYDHMNLTYSFECFLIIITDTKIKRHEKVRTNYPTWRSGVQQILNNTEAYLKILLALDSSSTFTLSNLVILK